MGGGQIKFALREFCPRPHPLNLFLYTPLGTIVLNDFTLTFLR